MPTFKLALPEKKGRVEGTEDAEKGGTLKSGIAA